MRREEDFGMSIQTKGGKMKKCPICGNKANKTYKYISGDHICREYQCSKCKTFWVEVD